MFIQMFTDECWQDGGRFKVSFRDISEQGGWYLGDFFVFFDYR